MWRPIYEHRWCSGGISLLETSGEEKGMASRDKYDEGAGGVMFHNPLPCGDANNSPS